MPEGWMIALFGVLMASNVAQASVIYQLQRKVGELTKAVKQACPWGSCPSYDRAKSQLSSDSDYRGPMRRVTDDEDKERH